jgi:glutamyl-tRNA synthetase
VRTRLAPSPTGALHLGNARTFLLTWLWARSRGAEVVLRVEDLDGPRTRKGAVEQALEDLAWLGIDWDGEVVYQSQRTAAYDEALERLRADGRVYPCVCTRREIDEAASAPHEGLVSDGPVYPGTCRYRFLPGDDVEQLTGRQPAWRFALEPGPVEFVDAFRGPTSIDPVAVGGDFVVAKKTGEAAYQLAVTVDDAWQGISDVIRGDDLIPSTPRQLLLYQALGLEAPRFTHLPLVRGGEDGRRLAKRHGDTRIAHYRELGVTPQRVVGLLAHWSGLTPREPVAAGDLVGDDWDWRDVPSQDVAWGDADDAWLRG